MAAPKKLIGLVLHMKRVVDSVVMVGLDEQPLSALHLERRSLVYSDNDFFLKVDFPSIPDLLSCRRIWSKSTCRYTDSNTWTSFHKTIKSIESNRSDKLHLPFLGAAAGSPYIVFISTSGM